MPETTIRRYETLVLGIVLVLVFTLAPALLAQGGRGGAPAGAPAAAPAAPGAPPAAGGAAAAQGGRGGAAPAAPQAPATAQASAPVDLTGYWVSVVTEDWIERMAPDSPRSGVLGRGGRGGGGAAAAAPPPPPPGETCRAYGAAGSMRVPGRIRITWADGNTMKIEMDQGTQTRLLNFQPANPVPEQKTLQGYSVANWELGAGAGGRGGGGGGGRGGAAAAAAPAAPRWGSLTAVTTNMSPGYLLTPRAAYTENARLTESFTRHTDFGVDYLTVTAVVVDGATTRIQSSTFKKEPDGSKFKPTGCTVVR